MVGEFVPGQQDRPQESTSQFPQGHCFAPCTLHSPVSVHFYGGLQGRGSMAGGKIGMGEKEESALCAGGRASVVGLQIEYRRPSLI